ncbi:cd9 antigen, variant 2 [Schistosoma haematobium]|uniref:Cd9 antigen, variant 2 n=1 Tax=Schistosoma haematobium TaxID=6185 RepID=A0A922IPG4_SCHHA|nr:cd9 antigen, variant 2 [Schistosoma haematobium]KAH9583210.1 cd9 antigen, variant 2 [Schistosoma haematobium]
MTKITFTSCFKCLKYSMFVFCLIAWVLGLITFIVGIVARVNGSFGILDAHIPAVHAGANLLIAVGFFIMIMGFFGCCGAIRESQCLLFLFFAFVFFCFTLLMAAGLWAVAWSSKVNHYMYRYLEEQVTRYRETEPENESTKLMDFIQKKMLIQFLWYIKTSMFWMGAYVASPFDYCIIYLVIVTQTQFTMLISVCMIESMSVH